MTGSRRPRRVIQVPGARQLLPHPGVGAVTALTTVLVLGPVRRFPGSKEVASYVGLAPTLHASADTRHLGSIPKQGSALLRMVLVQAAAVAARYDEDLKRQYCTLLRRRGHAKARVAVARQLLVRLCIMLRDRIDYEEFRRRGRAPHGPLRPVPACAGDYPSGTRRSRSRRSSRACPSWFMVFHDR